jgi:hypothetical protein
MRMSSVFFVVAAVIMALPFGFSLGVLIAYAMAGPMIGQLPMLTIPIATIASIVFALVPWLSARARFAVMAAGTILFVLIALVMAYR